MIIRLMLVMTFVCLCAFAQAVDVYTVTHKETVSGSNTALRIQLPASGNNRVEVVEMAVQCSASCSVMPESNGTAAVANGTTIVARTLVPLNPESTPTALITSPKAFAFSGPGLSEGVYKHGPPDGWRIPAEGLLPLPGGRILQGGEATSNFQLRIVGTYSGDVMFAIKVAVRR